MYLEVKFDISTCQNNMYEIIFANIDKITQQDIT